MSGQGDSQHWRITRLAKRQTFDVWAGQESDQARDIQHYSRDMTGPGPVILVVEEDTETLRGIEQEL